MTNAVLDIDHGIDDDIQQIRDLPTQKDHRVIAHLLHRDPDSLELLTVPFSTNPDQEHDDVHFIKLYRNKTPFVYWQGARVHQHELPSGEKYFTILTGEGKQIVIPYRSREFPAIQMRNSFRTMLDEGRDICIDGEDTASFENPFIGMLDYLRKIFEKKDVDASGLLPYQWLPEHEKAKNAHDVIWNPPQVCDNPFFVYERVPFMRQFRDNIHPRYEHIFRLSEFLRRPKTLSI